MRRLIEDQLLGWKHRPTRKPLLLDGARQVGKTYLIERLFGSREFRQVHRLDFRRDPGLATLFAESLDPLAIIGRVESRLNARLDIARDLIFFDEIGDCQRAVDSLKHFAEDLPQSFVCAASSNIGLLESVPVGQVRQLQLFPLCFEEFLMAAGSVGVLEAFRDRRRDAETHRQLWSHLRDYYFVGGMPEAVASWFQAGQGTKQGIDRVEQIHRNLVAGYLQDFATHAGKIPAHRIGAVFSSIPRQLAAKRDGSVRGFVFRGVVDKCHTYRQLRGPVDWLVAARLASKSYPIFGRPEPLELARARQNLFKLFSFDVGVLGHMLEMSYADHRELPLGRKGFIDQNFVQHELSVHVGHPTLRWERSDARIEFLHRCRNGEVIPVEVKNASGHSAAIARSLRYFINRYGPSRAIKLVGDAGGEPNGIVQPWPLYDAMFLRDL